ncbi:MAG: biopolymer transporter ExbD [Deltaproteobacteria bacterium]|nr:biopolymer transporter ExbD [Deltaproteobacteria bacterium]
MAGSPITDEEGEQAEVVAEINVTPLTDIFLVLLIIFMVTTTVIQEEGKNIDLPDAEVAEDTTPEGVTVTIDLAGRITVNEVVTEPAELEERLKQALAAARDKIVILRGDQSVRLGQAVNILDLAQKAGAKGIAISTEQPPPE